jgi:hypothetical protein
MGKLFITEEEKSRIKLLYEIASPPPNERELVIKDKNPFKDDEYIDARRAYSPVLKDGDRFYETKNIGGYGDWHSNDGYDKKYFIYKNVFEPILNDNINGKTVRISYNDKITEVSDVRINSDDKNNLTLELKMYIYVDYNKYGTQAFNEIHISDNGVKLYTPASSNTFGGQTYNFSSRETVLPEELKKDLTPFIDYCKKLMKEYKDKVTYYKDINNYKEMPDEHFDIYKVVRKKTDF